MDANNVDLSLFFDRGGETEGANIKTKTKKKKKKKKENKREKKNCKKDNEEVTVQETNEVLNKEEVNAKENISIASTTGDFIQFARNHQKDKDTVSSNNELREGANNLFSQLKGDLKLYPPDVAMQYYNAPTSSVYVNEDQQRVFSEYYKKNYCSNLDYLGTVIPEIYSPSEQIFVESPQMTQINVGVPTNKMNMVQTIVSVDNSQIKYVKPKTTVADTRENEKGEKRIQDNSANDSSKKKQRKKAQEIEEVFIKHVVKDTPSGRVCSISVDLPRDITYAITNLHQARQCFCQITPLGAVGHRRNHDLGKGEKTLENVCANAISLGNYFD